MTLVIINGLTPQLLGRPGRFLYLFAMLYRFFLWELLFVLSVTFAVTLLYVNRRKRQTPNDQMQNDDASAPPSDL